MCHILSYLVNVLINDIQSEHKNKSPVVKWLYLLFRGEPSFWKVNMFFFFILKICDDWDILGICNLATVKGPFMSSSGEYDQIVYLDKS